MRVFHLLLMFFSLNIAFGQAAIFSGTQIWEIASEPATCNKPGGQCLMVKFPGSKEFEVFKEEIVGFNFEQGTSYRISVRQEVKQPPIMVGESVFRYILVNIVSQKKYSNTTTAANQKGIQKVLDVNYEMVQCQTDVSKTCLLVKEKSQKEYEILDGTIIGFDFVPGYNYTITAKELPNGNYYFVNEISKKFVKPVAQTYLPMEVSGEEDNKIPASYSKNTVPKSTIQTSSKLDGKWYLRKFIEKEGSSFVTDDNIMWIEINTFNDQISGFGACNKFQAVLKSDLETIFEVSKYTAGYNNCGYKKLEDMFRDLLLEVDRFEIKNGNLILSKQWKYLMEFSSDPNKKGEASYTTTASAYTQSTAVKPMQAVVAPQSKLNSGDKEVEEMEKQIQELKAALEAKKQQEEAAVKQKEVEAEQEKLRQAEAARLQQEKLKKQQEIDALKQLLAEKEKELTQGVNNPVVQVKVQAKTMNTNYLNRAGYIMNNELVLFEDAESKLVSDGKSSLMQVNLPKSTVRFNKGNRPRFVIEMNQDSEPTDVFVLSCTKENSSNRQFLVSGITKNSMLTTISYGYKMLKPRVFEIVFVGDLEPGEYAFVDVINKKSFCFAID